MAHDFSTGLPAAEYAHYVREWAMDAVNKMDKNWGPWDLVAGGVLTAGIAFGVYKLGRGSSNVLCLRDRHGSAMPRELHDSARLQECIALALTGGSSASQIDVPLPPQDDPRTKALAESLRRSIEAEGRRNWDIAISANRRQAAAVASKDSICQICEDVLSGPSRRRRHQPHQHRELETSPTEHAKQLQAYKQRLDNWTAESEAKIEALEQQRLTLTTELRVTREALARTRHDKGEEERSRRLSDTRLKEVEERLQHVEAAESQLAVAEKQVRLLERQVTDLEEQLENVFQNNIVMPREAARENVDQHEQLRQRVEQLEGQLQERVQDIEEMENEISNLGRELRKVKKDQRDLAEENAMLQKQQHSAQEIVQTLARVMAADWGHLVDENSQEMINLAQVPNSDLSLDSMLQCVQAVIHRTIVHPRHRQPR